MKDDTCLYLPKEYDSLKNYLSSQELEGGCSQPSGFSDSEQSDTSSGNPTASKSSKPGSRMERSMMPQSLAISGSSMASPGEGSSISSQPDFLAPLFLALGFVEDKTILETCGLILSEPFAKWSHQLSSWRTCQTYDALNEIKKLGKRGQATSGEYLLTWPKASITFDGDAFRLPKWERPIEGTGSSFWRTPSSAVTEAKSSVVKLAGRSPQDPQVGLADQVLAREQWPTPTAGDGKNARNSTANRNSVPPTGVHVGDTLVDAVTKRPTPTARDYRSRGPSDANRHTPALNYVATNGEGNKLNPDWEELLMGWPMGMTSLEPMDPERFDRWLQGDVWADGWEDGVSRVVESMPNRSKRVKAIGNGQVPFCIATAFLLLVQGTGHEPNAQQTEMW